jgi:hypothetical protein
MGKERKKAAKEPDLIEHMYRLLTVLTPMSWDDAETAAAKLFAEISRGIGRPSAREIFDKVSKPGRGEHGPWKVSIAAYDEELWSLYHHVIWDREFKLAKHMKLQDAKFSELPRRIGEWLCREKWSDDVLAIFNDARQRAPEDGRAPRDPYRAKPDVFKGKRIEGAIRSRLNALKKRYTFIWQYETPSWPPR